MDLSPKKITMDGHNLLLMEKPAKVQYCCKGCKEKDVRPCYKHENNAGHGSYHLHKECYDSCKTHSIVFNLIGSNSNCEYVFRKEALGGKGVCDACGDDVKGWFFKCKLCKKPHYLHPCCAKLPIKKYVETGEEKITIDLKAKSPSKCLICGSKETSDGFSGWYYISRCGKYCYHWSCMKHMALKKWKKDDDRCKKKRGRGTRPPSSLASKRMTTETEIVTTQHPNQGKQKQDHDAGKRSEALPARAKDQDKKPCQHTNSQAMQASQNTKRRPIMKAVLGYTAEVAVELLNIFIPLIFGLPPLPLGLVLKLLK